MNDIVTIVCYGRKTQMPREDAKLFYLECIMCSEGSERDRYVSILCGLLSGAKICTDGD